MKCTQCEGRSQLPLCKTCKSQLDQMLADLSWLLHELEVTAARQDRLTVGMARPAERPSPANMGAVELLRSIQVQLSGLAHGVKLPPRMLVWWLRELDLASRDDAAHCYRAIQSLVGASGRGPVHDIINRCDRRFAGDCPDCGELCYARDEDIYITCGACKIPIDVAKNQHRALMEYDLLPERALLAVLDNLGEHVSRVKLYSWIKAGKIWPAGYLGKEGVVARKGGHRDPRVYSLTRARTLRRREQTPQLSLAYG